MYITEKSYIEFFKLIIIYLKSIWMILFKMKFAVEDYKKNISSITNKNAWEKYLNIIQD